MTSLRRLLVLVCLCAPALVRGADDPAPTSAHDLIKARLADEAKQKSSAPPATSPAATTRSTSANSGTPAASPSADKSPLLTHAAPPAESTDKPKPPHENPTVLPQVEVKKGRITELDQKLAKQEQEIAREKKNTKPTEVDKALNDSRAAKALSAFGGESAQYRQQVSSARVSLMEDEKDLIEAIAHAKTKAEKAELQKQLDALRAERRELEKSLRQ